MAIVSTVSSSEGSNENLSEYEKLRLEKIKRNEERMKELGLFRTKDELRKKSSKKPKSSRVSPELPQRRSSRKRKAVVDYSAEQVIPIHSDEEDENTDNGAEDEEESKSEENDDAYNFSEDGGDDVESDDDDQKYTPKPRPKRAKVVTSQEKVEPDAVIKNSSTFECINPKGGLTLEYAKTGRSTCRKCRVKIEKGKPRVGMEAWIVGRNCITWQCPKCLLQNLCCAYEKSNGGRGRCKATHTPFSKGELKIGIRCHTATSFYHVRALSGVLKNVIDLMKTDADHVNDNYELEIDAIDGNEALSTKDRVELEEILKAIHSSDRPTELSEETALLKNTSKGQKNATTLTKTNKERAATKEDHEQPKSGIKSGAKGKVEWKFGGRTCYGTLIPSKETKTHCYARTHRGNVKTLAKGKDYWSIVA